MSGSKNVAILGASGDRRKFGNKAVRAYSAAGWRVFPVNPREREVEGLTAYPALAEVPEPIDTVSVYLPAPVGLRLLPEIAARRPREVWINPGAESPALEAEAARLRLPVTYGCSIISLGHRPAEFPA